MKTPKKYEDVRLKAEKFSNDLSGIAYMDSGKIAFVDGLLPGEEALSRPYKSKKDFVNARALEILTPSGDRVAPRCRHFGTCGGCRIQHLQWEKHAQVKEQLFRETLTRQFKIQAPFFEIEPATAQWNYRNKMEYTVFPGSFEFTAERPERPADENQVVDERICAGFFKRGSHYRLIDLQECFLGDPAAIEILNAVKKWAAEFGIPPYDLKDQLGTLRNVIVRNAYSSKELMINIVVSDLRALLDEAINALTEALLPFSPASLYLTGNRSLSTAYVPHEQVLLHGKDHITETIRDVSFSISPNTFFQTNSEMAERLFSHAIEAAELTASDIVVDAYCGTGAVALLLAGSVKHVIGIDEVEDSIARAEDNSDLNEIRNAEFIFGKVEEKIDDVIKKNGPSVLVLDPPRVGLHPKGLQTIIGAGIRKIIYISCNPATLGRDLVGLVDAGYEINSIKPFDMFPNTPHIESVTVLSLKDERASGS